jgi:hypothetical protein
MTCIVTEKCQGTTLFERQSDFGSICELWDLALWPRSQSRTSAIDIFHVGSYRHRDGSLVISYKPPAVFRYSEFAVGLKSETRSISRFLPNPLAPMQYRNENVCTADSALYVHATCGAAAMLKWEFPETRIGPSSLSDRRLSFSVPTFYSCGAMSLVEAQSGWSYFGPGAWTLTRDPAGDRVRADIAKAHFAHHFHPDCTSPEQRDAQRSNESPGSLGSLLAEPYAQFRYCSEISI